MGKYLVVANQTALSAELTQALQEKAGQEKGAQFVLVVPATPVEHLVSDEVGDASTVAARRAGLALTHLIGHGVPVIGAHVGASSITVAIDEAVGARSNDYVGIIVCTFPPGLSRWLEPRLTEGLETAFHLPVIHVIAQPPHH